MIYCWPFDLQASKRLHLALEETKKGVRIPSGSSGTDFSDFGSELRHKDLGDSPAKMIHGEIQ